MPSSSKRAAERAAERKAENKWDKYRILTYRVDRIEKQERAVEHALARVRSARGHYCQSQGAEVWRVALKARQAEYERELLALDNLKRGSSQHAEARNAGQEGSRGTLPGEAPEHVAR